MRYLSKKWVTPWIGSMLVENAEFPSTKSLLGHTVAIDEVRYNHYRQPVDQAGKWRRLAKNLSPNAAMSK